MFQYVTVPECPCACVSVCGCFRVWVCLSVGVSVCLCVDVALCPGPSAYCLMHAGRINLFAGGWGEGIQAGAVLFSVSALRLSTRYYCYQSLKRQLAWKMKEERR